MEDSYRTHTNSIWNQQTTSAFQTSCNLKPVFPYRSFLVFLKPLIPANMLGQLRARKDNNNSLPGLLALSCHTFFLFKKIINLLHGARRQAVVDALYLLI